jgi:hypothetical protein
MRQQTSALLAFRMGQAWLGAFRPTFAAVLAFASSGCSLLFIKAPPESPPSQFTPGSSIECTSSKIAPGFDTAFAALEVVRTGLAASADDSVYSNPNQPLSRGADVALGIGFASLFLGSAIYGYATTARCSRLQRSNVPVAQDPVNPGDTQAQPTAPPTHPWQDNVAPVHHAPVPVRQALPEAPAPAPTPASAPTPAPTPTPATSSAP